LQPVFQLVEGCLKQRSSIQQQQQQQQQVHRLLSVGLRLLYVAAVTVVGIIIPFFGSLMVSKCYTIAWHVTSQDDCSIPVVCVALVAIGIAFLGSLMVTRHLCCWI
jgi:hypothetical protein